MMTQKSFYLDTCIWLNLFKKEGDSTKGTPYWKIAKDFIEKVDRSNDLIVVSSIVLKELTFKLGEKYSLVKDFFDKSNYIKSIKTIPEDYSFARKLESDLEYGLSFFDCLHIAITKRLNMNLITRDEELIKIANQHVSVDKPEELID